MLCRYLSTYFEIKIANNPAFKSFFIQEAIAIFECEEINADGAIRAVKKFDFSWLAENRFRTHFSAKKETKFSKRSVRK